MFFFNTRIISSSDGSYGDNGDLNIAELKAIMKNLIINEEPRKSQGVIWADTNKKENRVQMVRDSSAQTDMTIKPNDPKKYSFPAPNDSSGGRVWAYSSKKKKPSVKTFAL